MKSIFILCKSLDGGTGTFVSSLERGLIREGYLTHILVLEKPTYNSSIKAYINLNSIHSYPNKYFFNIQNILLVIKELIWLHKLQRTNNPSVYITIDYHCSLLIELYKAIFLKSNIRTILTFHNNLSYVFKIKTTPLIQKINIILGRILFNKSPHIVCVSKGLSEEIKRIFTLKNTPITIYPGIKIPSGKRKALNSESNNILSISRLDKQKDIETLIKALQIVFRKIKDAKLFIIGDGGEKRKLKNLVSALGLNKAVKFLGWKKNISTYLENADLFVFSSHYEGFGIAIIEAMAWGIPIVSTNSPYGPSEILNNGEFGILVPLEDFKSLAEKSTLIMLNKEKRNYYSSQSLKRIIDFSETTMIRKYLRLVRV